MATQLIQYKDDVERAFQPAHENLGLLSMNALTVHHLGWDAERFIVYYLHVLRFGYDHNDEITQVEILHGGVPGYYWENNWDACLEQIAKWGHRFTGRPYEFLRSHGYKFANGVDIR